MEGIPRESRCSVRTSLLRALWRLRRERDGEVAVAVVGAAAAADAELVPVGLQSKHD